MYSCIKKASFNLSAEQILAGNLHAKYACISQFQTEHIHC